MTVPVRTAALRVVLLAGIGLAAVVPAAGATIRVAITKDSAAPSGATPKLNFKVTGLVRGAQYFLRWDTASSSTRSDCTLFGSSITLKVRLHTLKLTLPDGSYDGGYYKPFCDGLTYRGRVVRKLPRYRSSTVKTFRFDVNGLR